MKEQKFKTSSKFYLLKPLGVFCLLLIPAFLLINSILYTFLLVFFLTLFLIILDGDGLLRRVGYGLSIEGDHVKEFGPFGRHRSIKIQDIKSSQVVLAHPASLRMYSQNKIISKLINLGYHKVRGGVGSEGSDMLEQPLVLIRGDFDYKDFPDRFIDLSLVDALLKIKPEIEIIADPRVAQFLSSEVVRSKKLKVIKKTRFGVIFINILYFLGFCLALLFAFLLISPLFCYKYPFICALN